MSRIRTIATLICAVMWAGCGYAAGVADRATILGSTGTFAADSQDDDGLAANSFDAGLIDASKSIASSEQLAATPARRMVYSANLQLEVARVEDAIAACRGALQSTGGFLAARHGGTLTCRVPAAEFEAFLAAVRQLGRVIDEAMDAQDVTKQHRDLTIRLENARKARERLIALLESATEVKDVLDIERELQRLTEEIERGTAELAALDERVAFSTVMVAFRASANAGRSGPRHRHASRFGWINTIGIDELMRWF